MNLTDDEGRDQDGVDQSAQHPRGYEPGEKADGDQGPDDQGQQDRNQDRDRLSHPEQGPYQPEQGNQAIHEEDRQPDR